MRVRRLCIKRHRCCYWLSAPATKSEANSVPCGARTIVYGGQAARVRRAPQSPIEEILCRANPLSQVLASRRALEPTEGTQIPWQELSRWVANRKRPALARRRTGADCRTRTELPQIEATCIESVCVNDQAAMNKAAADSCSSIFLIVR